MNKTKTASEELIDYILSMTPEQVEKVLKHPVFVAVMDEYGHSKEVEK